MQKKLLRALQDGEIRAVGSTKAVRVDVRIVSASNRRLVDMVRDKRFREDLYYRLNGVTIELPPLRERKEDIPALAGLFLRRAAKELSREPPAFAPEALQRLVAYRWPGNVRQLDNELRRCIALLGDEREITADMLSPDVLEAAP
jgi:transcriptional regulator with PAS, ATPase and Fis domain